MSSIPLMKPFIPEQSKKNVEEVLNSGFLVQGKFTQLLEEHFQSYFDVKEAIMVSNGTSSLHLALLALGVGPGDEVIVPGLSFIATANVVELVGAKPVFVDVSLSDNNIDVDKIEEQINQRTKAIMPVHEFGLMSNMSAIMKIAKSHDLKVIEDAACALGAEYDGIRSGMYGDISSFSFHPRKTITSGEGGLIITQDKDLADKMRALRNHGFHFENGHSSVVIAGYNYRITDIQSALLHGQLETLNDQIAKKSRIASSYLELLNKDLFHLPMVAENAKHSWQTFHIVLKEKSLNRDKILELLRQENIGCNFGAQCMPGEQYYKDKYQLNLEDYYSNSLYISRYGIALPLFYSMELKQVKVVAEKLNNIVEKQLSNA